MFLRELTTLLISKATILDRTCNSVYLNTQRSNPTLRHGNQTRENPREIAKISPGARGKKQETQQKPSQTQRNPERKPGRTHREDQETRARTLPQAPGNPTSPHFRRRYRRGRARKLKKRRDRGAAAREGGDNGGAEASLPSGRPG